MPAALFGYTVEEQDGSLVITVRGQLAERALGQLRDGLEAGGRLSIMRLLSPLMPIGRLLSAPIEMRAGMAGGVSPAASIPSEGPTSQELDQTFKAFQEQLGQFRAAVGELQAAAPSPQRKR